MGEKASTGDREYNSNLSNAEGPEWSDYFGFDEPYENQVDAIETAIQTASNRGFLAMEGPCGTGKTMASLTAAAYLIRESDQYDNAIIVTPVKQQLQQFIDDLRALNRTLENPLSGLALVGKSDLCPYGREDVFPPGSTVHDRCEDLRENTAHLVQADADHSLDSKPADGTTASTAVSTRRDPDEQWWDPQRGSDLARAARHDSEGFRTEVDEPLGTAGARSPYQRQQPSAPDSMVAGNNTPLYCPFEADWYARDKGSPVGFHHGEANVITSDEFLPESVEYGTCPHRVMGVLLEEAEILIGNYNHLFDSRTRHLTESILDESTFVIVDEAHRLEERVRDMLSDTIGRRTLLQARRDIDLLLRYARQSTENEQHVKARLASYDIPYSIVERTAGFYGDVLEWLGARIETHFQEEFDDYRALFGSDQFLEREIEIPLRDPETDEDDELREWGIENGYAGDFWRALGTVGAAVEDILDEVDGDRSCVCAPVGTLLGYWWERDHTTYFREITLEYSPKEQQQQNLTYQWEQYYNPSLMMYNCIPSDELKRIFDGLGGGILMSATLEPIDIFREVTGLDAMGSGSDNPADRPIVERTYDLLYPPENRASWIVDAPPFTARNRGEPSVSNRNKTRETYAYALRTIARSRGNILLCLPNYREARWAAERLREDIEKAILLDESSSNEQTTELKQEFFDGEEKVLVTSTRGTLTEGVDYDGDKLHVCATVGVPLVNIGSPRIRAVKNAYGDRFGDENAFEYALTVPAVRRSRQAIGRVIRGPDEKGVRILLGNRYTPDAFHNTVYEYLPEKEREEFVRMKPMFLESQFEKFWG